MFDKKYLAMLLVAGLTAAGCSSVRVVKNPDEGDPGVRYYRPKPYLLVTPADPTGRMVNLKLEYLPDYAEEYSVHVRGKAAVALKDGWNLIGVTTKGSPPPPPAKEEPPAPAPAPAPPALPMAVVAATNVPMGYYESVYELIGPTKYFKGWKYIGFTVLGPTKPGICRRPEGPGPNGGGGGGGGGGHFHGGGNGGNGVPSLPGECFTGPLYGMVFFNGVMTFRQIEEIANNQLCPTFVNPAPGYVAPQTTEVERKTVVEDVKTKRSEGEVAPVPAPVDRPSAVVPVPPAPAPPPAAVESTPPPTPPTPAPSTPPPGASNARKPKAGATRNVVLDLPPLPPGFDR